MAAVVLCSLLEFSSNKVQLPERGHGQSQGFSTVPGVWHTPFAAKEAGINQSTGKGILFYPWSHSSIKKVRSEKLSLLHGSHVLYFFSLFRKRMSDNSYTK